MPLDDGCRFDQHHGVEDLRPELVKATPRASGRWKRAEGGQGVADAGRSPGVAEQQVPVPARRGRARGTRAGNRQRTEVRSCPRRYGHGTRNATLARCFRLFEQAQGEDRATRTSRSYTVPLASVPHQRPEPRWADIPTGKPRTGAKFAPIGPHASNDKCHRQRGDDQHQQTENLFWGHGDLAFHAGDKLTA